MDNVFYKYEDEHGDYSSSSSDDIDESSENIHDTRFMSMARKMDYEKHRNKLFTKDIIKKRIVVDSHNYFQGKKNFNTSDFDVLFDLEKKKSESSQTEKVSSLITTNYDIYHNVIGFKLLKTTIRTPPYNINKTNNIIKYKVKTDGIDDGKIHSIIINPGQYEVGELADVFQKYKERIDMITRSSLGGNDGKIVEREYSQYVTYVDSDGETGQGTVGAPTVPNPPVGTPFPLGLEYPSSFTNTPYTFKVTFHTTDSTTLGLNVTESNRELKALIFKMEYYAETNQEVEFLWDYNNITRGAARLFGFLPEVTSTTDRTVNSNRLLDVSSHFVDLVIPEIPSIACKRNSSGRDIIERIQLKANHGEYLHYRTAALEDDNQPYFNPMKLHRINIQLWAVNNELYDTNNSDVSFEFEITMLKNIGLLR